MLTIMSQVRDTIGDPLDWSENGRSDIFLFSAKVAGPLQGLGNELIVPEEDVGKRDGEITSRERLGGLLRYYHRKAA